MSDGWSRLSFGVGLQGCHRATWALSKNNSIIRVGLFVSFPREAHQQTDTATLSDLDLSCITVVAKSKQVSNRNKYWFSTPTAYDFLKSTVSGPGALGLTPALRADLLEVWRSGCWAQDSRGTSV